MSKKFKTLNIIEYILGLLAFVSLFLFIHLSMSAELHDPDIWLHIKTGEYIVQQKSIPHVDIFSSTMSGKSWIDHSWLVQLIFYLVFHYGGPDSLIFLSAITVISAFLFLFFSAYRQRQHLVLAVAVLAITVFASRIRFNIRPENFSILFFSIYLFLLTRHIRKKWIFILPLVQLLWVNCHGFFILGPLLVGVFILAEKLKQLGLLPWGWPKVEPLDTLSYKNLLRVFFWVCVVCLLNPYALKGVLYPVSVIFGSAGKSGIFYRHVQELLPTWELRFNLVSLYYLLAIISFLVFLINFKKINTAHLIIWLIFLAISYRVNRNIIFFNFVAFISAMDNLIRGAKIKKPAFLERALGKPIYALRYIVLATIIISTAKTNSNILESQYYIFEENRTKSVLLGISAKFYPQKAADFIVKNDLPGNMFNMFNHGSYLIYRLFPKKMVFIDGRTELYGGDFFVDYQKILNIDKYTVSELFKKYDINTVLLSGKVSDIGNLASYFYNSTEWALVFFEENSVIFLKDAPQNKNLIDKLRIDLKSREVQKADPEKIGLRRIFPEPYIKFAWLYYYLGLDKQAFNQAKEALRIMPNVPDAYNIMGRIYTKQKLYERAFETLRLANIYEPDRIETLVSLGGFYMETGEFKEANKVYKKLIRLNPSSAEGFYFLGRSYDKLGNIKSAIGSLRKAIKINPFYAKYYEELGGLLYKNRDDEGAIKTYKNAIDLGLGPDNFNGLIREINAATEVK